MADLATSLGLSTFVILSVVVVAWRMGRVEGGMAGVERSVERLQADVARLREDAKRLRDDIGRLRDDVEAILLRMPAKAE